MKSFIFESIWLLSRRDQRARAISFHPNKNLIVGRNHTGKSSIIKNLFLTLGARPQGKLAQWDENAISVVSFIIDQKKFRAVHQSGNRALFSEEGQLIVAASSHEEWSKAFANITGFNLVLTDKDMATVVADARCFFLPFYINQDGSWQAGWDTFVGLQQYRAAQGAILDYFSGVRPPAFYELNSKRTQLQRALDELQKEHALLEKARDRLGKSVHLNGPKIDPINFENEISRLTAEVTQLNQLQEKLKDAAVREKELLFSIKLQIDLAADALATYDRDSSFLQSEPHPTLACPTCGAEHTKSFLDVLTYAEDARVLRELVGKLHVDSTRAEDRYRKTRGQLSELESHYKRVSGILETRRGDLEFGDVVRSMGAESAFQAFENEALALRSEIDRKLGEIDALSKQLDDLADSKRSKAILKIFREAYATALVGLNLPPIDTSRFKLTSRPDLSGSGGPRSVLAYYAALWKTCLSEYGSFSAPLVIDAPQQQGQDDINLPKILQFISEDLPRSTQIIVGIEMDTHHSFDKKIPLDQPYKLLQEEEYDAIESHVEPLLQSMYKDLLSPSREL